MFRTLTGVFGGTASRRDRTQGVLGSFARDAVSAAVDAVTEASGRDRHDRASMVVDDVEEDNKKNDNIESGSDAYSNIVEVGRQLSQRQTGFVKRLARAALRRLRDSDDGGDEGDVQASVAEEVHDRDGEIASSPAPTTVSVGVSHRGGFVLFALITVVVTLAWSASNDVLARKACLSRYLNTTAYAGGNEVTHAGIEEFCHRWLSDEKSSAVPAVHAVPGRRSPQNIDVFDDANEPFHSPQKWPTAVQRMVKSAQLRFSSFTVQETSNASYGDRRVAVGQVKSNRSTRTSNIVDKVGISSASMINIDVAQNNNISINSSSSSSNDNSSSLAVGLWNIKPLTKRSRTIGPAEKETALFALFQSLVAFLPPAFIVVWLALTAKGTSPLISCSSSNAPVSVPPAAPAGSGRWHWPTVGSCVVGRTAVLFALTGLALSCIAGLISWRYSRAPFYVDLLTPVCGALCGGYPLVQLCVYVLIADRVVAKRRTVAFVALQLILVASFSITRLATSLATSRWPQAVTPACLGVSLALDVTAILFVAAGGVAWPAMSTDVGTAEAITSVGHKKSARRARARRPRSARRDDRPTAADSTAVLVSRLFSHRHHLLASVRGQVRQRAAGTRLEMAFLAVSVFLLVATTSGASPLGLFLESMGKRSEDVLFDSLIVVLALAVAVPLLVLVVRALPFDVNYSVTLIGVLVLVVSQTLGTVAATGGGAGAATLNRVQHALRTVASLAPAGIRAHVASLAKADVNDGTGRRSTPNALVRPMGVLVACEAVAPLANAGLRRLLGGARAHLGQWGLVALLGIPLALLGAEQCRARKSSRPTPSAGAAADRATLVAGDDDFDSDDEDSDTSAY